MLVESVSFINSVLNNLLTNATKFSFPDSEIEINAKSTDGIVKIIIKDKGIGMSDNIVEKLFDINAATSRTGTKGEIGTGYGMSLVKKFIDFYGGMISVDSKDINKHPDKHGTEIQLILKKGK